MLLWSLGNWEMNHLYDLGHWCQSGSLPERGLSHPERASGAPIQSHGPSAEGKSEDTGPSLRTTPSGAAAHDSIALWQLLSGERILEFGPRASSDPASLGALGDGITPISDFSYSGKDLTFNQASTICRAPDWIPTTLWDNSISFFRPKKLKWPRGHFAS